MYIDKLPIYLFVALGLPCIIEVKYPNIVKLLKHPIFFLTTCQKEVALIKDVWNDEILLFYEYYIRLGNTKPFDLYSGFLLWYIFNFMF